MVTGRGEGAGRTRDGLVHICVRLAGMLKRSDIFCAFAGACICEGCCAAGSDTPPLLPPEHPATRNIPAAEMAAALRRASIPLVGVRLKRAAPSQAPLQRERTLPSVTGLARRAETTLSTMPFARTCSMN